jgi:hypothetical protein
MKIKDIIFEMSNDEDDFDGFPMMEYVGIDIKEMFDLNIFLQLENGEDLVEQYFIPDYSYETIYIPRKNYDLYLSLIREMKINDILK